MLMIVSHVYCSAGDMVLRAEHEQQLNCIFTIANDYTTEWGMTFIQVKSR